MFQKQIEFSAKLNHEIEEVCGRLHSHYAQVPAEAIQAFLDEEQRKNASLETVLQATNNERTNLGKKVAEKDIEIAHLNQVKRSLEDNEERLTKQVVHQTFQIERLMNAYGAIGGAGGSSSGSGSASQGVDLAKAVLNETNVAVPEPAESAPAAPAADAEKPKTEQPSAVSANPATEGSHNAVDKMGLTHSYDDEALFETLRGLKNAEADFNFRQFQN